MVEEEEKETIIKLATPDKGSVMPPANYQIGVLAQPQQHQKSAAETVGETVGSKVGEAALVGGGPEGTFFEKGLWGKMQPGFSKFFGGASAPYAATGMQTMGMAPGQLLAMGSNPALAGTVSASGAAAPGMMAGLASNPLGWAVLGGLALRKLFRNKGGAVHANMGGLLDVDMGKFKGPLAGLLPQYKEHGGSSSSSSIPRTHNTISGMPKEQASWMGNFLDKWGLKSNLHRLMGHDSHTQRTNKGPGAFDSWYPGHSERVWWGNEPSDGMMAGPLSNNKSVKMEKKETIEYKN